MALGKPDEKTPAAEVGEDLQAHNEALQATVTSLTEANEELVTENATQKEQLAAAGQENEALQEQVSGLDTANKGLEKALKEAGGKPAAPVKMEKPGAFYARVSMIRDPYSEKIFYPDSTRAVEVKPMTSWIDSQIKAKVLLRA